MRFKKGWFFLKSMESLDRVRTTVSILKVVIFSYTATLVISLMINHPINQSTSYEYLLILYNFLLFLSYYIIKRIHFTSGLHLFMLTMLFMVVSYDLAHPGFQNLTILLYMYPIALCIFLFDSPSSLGFSFLFALAFILRSLFLSNLSINEIWPMFLLSFLAVFTLISIKRWLSSLLDQKVESIHRVHRATLNILANVSEIKDRETHAHLKRVSLIIEILARELKKQKTYTNYITEKYIEDLKTAASLHDIGKIGISDNIILKKGSLTNEEFEEIKKHTLIGYDLIAQARHEAAQESFYDIATEIVRHHHEKWDGCGYPDQLKGEEIPLSARIMAIVDVYDALISRRSYKEAYSHDVAVRIIQDESGTHFDPVVVEAFVNRASQIQDKTEVEWQDFTFKNVL